MDKKLFPCRIEELPVIGGFVYNSFVRDTNDFLPYTDYHAPFPLNYFGKLGEVEAAVSPVTFINQMKVVTLNLLTNSFGLRPLINSAEICFNSAGSGLNVLVKDMGQSQVRDAINRGDVEALLLAMKNLNTNIFNNSALLITKGLTLIMQNALKAAALAIKTDNDLQNTLMGTRSNATASNMVLYNFFWVTYLSPTRTTGQLIFKISNKTKAKDYIIAQLIARMRHDEAQTQVHGNVTNALGQPQNRAKVKLIPVDGGRTKTVYTDAEGNYVVSGMRATAYNQVVTKGALLKINACTVVTREHLELNSVIV